MTGSGSVTRTSLSRIEPDAQEVGDGMNIELWKILVILMAPLFGAGGPMQLRLQRSCRPGLDRYRP